MKDKSATQVRPMCFSTDKCVRCWKAYQRVGELCRRCDAELRDQENEAMVKDASDGFMLPIQQRAKHAAIVAKYKARKKADKMSTEDAEGALSALRRFQPTLFDMGTGIGGAA